jgi:hypothetical protein
VGSWGGTGQGGGGRSFPERWVDVWWRIGGGTTVLGGRGVLGGRRSRDSSLAPRGGRKDGEGGLNRQKEAWASGSLRGRTAAASQQKPKRSTSSGV